MKKKQSKIWITWEKQRRNEGISNAIDFELKEIIWEKNRLLRYIISIIRTINILFYNKPEIVAAQNPSILLAFMVVILKKIFRYKVLIDAHNSGISPIEEKSTILNYASKFIQKYSDLTLVTNKFLKITVESNNGRAFILPDKIPIVPCIKQSIFLVKRKVNIAYICTYKKDEPYQEVIKAASNLNKKFFIYFTGNFNGKINPSIIPGNIKLLGFIPDDKYWALLSAVDIVMDLTTREGCLVCGAYEAIALNKPIILSDTNAQKTYFRKGCVFVSTAPESIVAGINQTVKSIEKLKKEIKVLKKSLNDDWQDRILQLKNIIESMTHSH